VPGALALLFCALVLFAGPARVWAHPELDRAIRLSGELEFTAALRTFQKALDSGSLTKPELAKLLAERALLLHALRRRGEVVADFRWLAAVDPDYRLDQRAPPDLTAIWDSLRQEAGGASAVELRDESQAGLLRLRPLIKGAHPEGLHIDARYRLESGAFEPIDEVAGVERPLPSGAQVQAYASLKGLGDVVLASQGSADQPLVFEVPAAGAPRADASRTEDDHQPRSTRKWWWIGGAAAVVVVAAVVTAAALASGRHDSKDVRIRPVASF
jgi:hypothetical protein